MNVLSVGRRSQALDTAQREIDKSAEVMMRDLVKSRLDAM